MASRANHSPRCAEGKDYSFKQPSGTHSSPPIRGHLNYIIGQWMWWRHWQVRIRHPNEPRSSRRWIQAWRWVEGQFSFPQPRANWEAYILHELQLSSWMEVQKRRPRLSEEAPKEISEAPSPYQLWWPIEENEALKWYYLVVFQIYRQKVRRYKEDARNTQTEIQHKHRFCL